jgi:glycosyltransferase involved in cell wall biosynthesis
MADIYVHTALYEGLCKTIVEASASGLPVVTTEFSGLSQTLVSNVSGFIVHKDDSDAFVEKVLKLADDKGLRKEMGDKGRSFILENFDYDKGVKNITQFWYKSMIKYKY